MQHWYQDFLGCPVADDPAWPRHRLARNLYRYGMRGPALDAEVERVVRGPWYDRASRWHLAEPFHLRSPGDCVVYPYGWRRHELSRLMRRVFHGHGRWVSHGLDEVWQTLHGRDVLDWARGLHHPGDFAGV